MGIFEEILMIVEGFLTEEEARVIVITDYRYEK